MTKDIIVFLIPRYTFRSYNNYHIVRRKMSKPARPGLRTNTRLCRVSIVVPTDQKRPNSNYYVKTIKSSSDPIAGALIALFPHVI